MNRATRNVLEGAKRLRVPAVVGPGLISTDVANQRPPVPPKRPPRPWELAAEEQKKQALELVGLFHQIATSLGGIESFEKAAAKNDVLYSGAVTFGASGIVEQHGFPTSFGSITVANFGPGLVTATAMTPQSQAPTVGGGVQRIRGGTQRTFNISGNALTLYGPAGETIDLTVYTRPRAPASSRCASGVLTRVVESQTPLAANAVFNGGTVDCGAGSTRFRGSASSDQAGIINMQESPDGITWRTTVTEPMGAGATINTTVEMIQTYRYCRVQVVNGATAQTSFLCASSAVED